MEINKMTSVEKILMEEDFEYWDKKENNLFSKIRKNIASGIFDRTLDSLEAINYNIAVSFSSDIYFRKEYIRVQSIYDYRNPLGRKIFYIDIDTLEYHGGKCTIKYKTNSKVKVLKFKCDEESYGLLKKVLEAAK